MPKVNWPTKADVEQFADDYNHYLDAFEYALMANRHTRRAGAAKHGRIKNKPPTATDIRQMQAAHLAALNHNLSLPPPAVVVKKFTTKLANAMNKPGVLTTLAKANDARVQLAPNTRLLKILGPDYVKNILTSDVQQDFRTDEWLLKLIRLDGGRMVVPFTRVSDKGMKFSDEHRAQLVLFLS